MGAETRSVLIQIQKLICQKKFREAHPLAEEAVGRYPDEPLLYTALAICHCETNDVPKAIDVLQTAVGRFPESGDLMFDLADTLNSAGRYREAEDAYRKALDLTPRESTKERSECYNGLAVALWEQQHRSDALLMWKQAIKEDPRNAVARENLRHCTNEFNEPAASSKLFNDLYHFQRIQTERYFHAHGREGFESPEEAQRVLGAIMTAWNKHMAPHGREIDAMSPAEKTALFQSIRVVLD